MFELSATRYMVEAIDETRTSIAALSGAWFGWMVRQAEAYRLVCDAGLAISGVPLLRSLLEHAGAVRWLLTCTESDALRVLEDGQRLGRWRLEKTLADETGSESPARPEQTADPRLFGQFDNVEQMLGASHMQYAPYRNLSGPTHPSAHTFLPMLRPFQGEPLAMAVQRVPAENSPRLNEALFYLGLGGDALRASWTLAPEFAGWLARVGAGYEAPDASKGHLGG